MNGVYHFAWGLPMQNGNGYGTYHMINGKFPLWTYCDYKGNFVGVDLPQGCEEIKP